MRPETGNNSPSADNRKVSVRLDSGGHSFSADNLPKRAFAQDVQVEFTVVTHKTVLVPAEAFDPEAAAALLAVAGLPCSADEEPLCITAGDKTAVAAIDCRCATEIARLFGGRAAFVSPLLHDCPAEERRLCIRTLGKVTFFTITDNGRLRFAEAFRTENSDEVLYYTRELDRRCMLEGYLIYIYGDEASETARLLKRYYKKVKCE